METLSESPTVLPHLAMFVISVSCFVAELFISCIIILIRNFLIKEQGRKSTNMKNHHISTFGQFDLLKRSQYDLIFLITWILFPGVLQVTLRSQGCVTQSAAAPSTTKTASPRPLLWLTRRDMCRSLLCSSSSRLCRYFSSTWTHELFFSRWHCVVEWEK